MDIDPLDIDLQSAIPRRTLHARSEVRKDYRCKHCGFTGIARVFGRGAANRSVLMDAVHLEEEAYGQAVAEGETLLPFVVCPQCKRPDATNWAAFQRQTHIYQGIAAAVVITIIVLAMRENPNAAVGVFLFLVGACVVFFLGVQRRFRAEAAEKRISFLSPEEIAAEAAQAAQEAAERERVKLVRAKERSAPKKKKRSRF